MILKKDLIKCIQFHRFLSYSPVSHSANKVRTSSVNNADAKSEAVDDADWFNQINDGDINERVVPRPVSYLPDHLPQTRKRIKNRPWWKFKYFVDVNTLPIEDENYTKEPQYPEIFPNNREGMKKRIRLEWYKAIRGLPTAEQKIYEINKHYSFLSYIIGPVMKQFNMLPIQQQITKTNLIRSLPDSYKIDDLKLDDSLKQIVLSSIANRLYSTTSYMPTSDFTKKISLLGKPKRENYIQSKIEDDIFVDLVNNIRNFLQSNQNLVLPNVQVDYEPFVGTSWWLNDTPIPFIKRSWYKEDRFDQCFTYKSSHSLHLRSENPLPEVVPLDHELCTNTDLPKFDYNLLKLGVYLKRHNILSLPGFWPDHSEGFDFSNLICLNRQDIRLRDYTNRSNFDDKQDVLDGMAIMSSFAWLTSIANNLGFTLYDHLTYPLVTNVVSTDGQYWSFYVYQLNNHTFYSDVVRDNVFNLCWSSGEMKLFDKYENGTFHGVNDDVLKYFVKFMMCIPKNATSQELRPYLGVDDRSEDDKKELSYSLRRKFSNRINHFIARRKKVNLWEKIYKYHKDAPLDVKRTRPKREFKFPPFFK